MTEMSPSGGQTSEHQASAGLARTAGLSQKGASESAASVFDCRKEIDSLTQSAQITVFSLSVFQNPG